MVGFVCGFPARIRGAVGGRGGHGVPGGRFVPRVCAGVRGCVPVWLLRCSTGHPVEVPYTTRGGNPPATRTKQQHLNPHPAPTRGAGLHPPHTHTAAPPKQEAADPPATAGGPHPLTGVYRVATTTPNRGLPWPRGGKTVAARKGHHGPPQGGATPNPYRGWQFLFKNRHPPETRRVHQKPCGTPAAHHRRTTQKHTTKTKKERGGQSRAAAGGGCGGEGGGGVGGGRGVLAWRGLGVSRVVLVCVGVLWFLVCFASRPHN